MGTAPATHSLTAPTVNALADGLNKGEFVPFYQPLWDVQHQCWEGAETLIRWQHPTEGLIQSDTFIPVAEQSGLILELGAFVLRAACQQMMHWRQRGLPEGIIAVNVSALQIHQPDFVEDLARILRDTGLPGGYANPDRKPASLPGAGHSPVHRRFWYREFVAGTLAMLPSDPPKNRQNLCHAYDNRAKGLRHYRKRHHPWP